MERFEVAALLLVPGQRVRIRITRHEPWGVMVEVQGHEAVGASVDAVMIDSPSGASVALPEEYPLINAEIDAAVSEVRADHPPAWVRLTLRAKDLEVYQRPCGPCGEAAGLSPGGDGVSIEVRSADGPGTASLAAHRH